MTSTTASVNRHKFPAASLRRFILKVATVVVVASVLLYAGISAYVADRLSHPDRKPLTSTPADYGLAYERVHFSSAVDAIPLEGWYINAQAPKTIVILHGRDSTRDGYPSMDVAQALVESGYAVLLFDFRAHGESGGTRFSLGMLEVRDVEGALAYLRTRAVGMVGVIGFSLGADTALNSAPDQPMLHAIVADSPFADLQPLLEAELTKFSGLPAPFTPGIEGMAQFLFGIDLANNKPVRAVARLGERPLLLIHGTADDQVPLSQEYELQRAAAGDPNLQVWIADGAEHVQAYKHYPEEFMRRVLRFFAMYLS